MFANSSWPCDCLAHIRQTWGRNIGTLLAPFLSYTNIFSLLRCWLPLVCCQKALFWCPFQMCFLAFHDIKETTTPSPRQHFMSYHLFHIRWELCLLRVPFQLITYMCPKIIQARDTSGKFFF